MAHPDLATVSALPSDYRRSTVYVVQSGLSNADLNREMTSAEAGYVSAAVGAILKRKRTRPIAVLRDANGSLSHSDMCRELADGLRAGLGGYVTIVPVDLLWRDLHTQLEVGVIRPVSESTLVAVRAGRIPLPGCDYIDACPPGALHVVTYEYPRDPTSPGPLAISTTRLI